MKPRIEKIQYCMVIILFCIVTAASAPAFAAKKMALVIGNSQYDTSPLKNPANDATDMAALLKSAGFDVILRTDADKRAMLESIEAFGRKLPRAEIGMVYFAGHGMQIRGRNYLIPVNARVASETDVELESVDVYRVLGRMEAAANPVNIIILDACRDNPFERSFRNTEKGLAKIDAPAGSIIVFATSPGGVAADGRGRNGIFTSHLLKTLAKPDISLTRALMETRRNVAAETSRQQIPWESSSLMQDVFLLAGGAPEDRDLLPVQPQQAQPQPVPLSSQKLLEIPKKAQLYVVTDPGGGRVRIINIVEKYYDGIELNLDRYKLEGSMDGYRTKTQWITIDRPGIVDVTLTLTPELTKPEMDTPTLAAPIQTAPHLESKQASKSDEVWSSALTTQPTKLKDKTKKMIFKWQPSSWVPSGVTWDTINDISRKVTQKTNGRLTMTPSAPGAIVPVHEQLSAVGMGIMKATFIWPGYFPGELPVAFMHGDCFAAPKTIGELRYLYETYEDGKIMDILRTEYAKHGVHLVGNMYWILDNLMISKKPINGVDDIKGMKFRTSELIALQLADLGAGTIWVPGGEIYTMLSRGAVDAITFSHAADMVAMGFHEVTKYWVKSPKAVGPAADALIVNLKEWNKLPDDLKAILETALEAGTTRNHYEAERVIGEAWEYVEGKGIKIIEWSEKDAKILGSKAREVVPRKYLNDPAFSAIISIVDKWAVEMGYWNKK